jgi:hypothetical protein
VRNGAFRKNTVKVRPIALSSSGTKDADRLKLQCLPSTTFTGPAAGFSRAEVVTNAAQLIEGSNAFGRSAISASTTTRSRSSSSSPAGRPRDRPLRRQHHRRRPRPPRRHRARQLRRLGPGINVENTPNYTSVIVLNDGTNGSRQSSARAAPTTSWTS